jgi:hypothetical protein
MWAYVKAPPQAEQVSSGADTGGAAWVAGAGAVSATNSSNGYSGAATRGWRCRDAVDSKQVWQ